MITIFLFQHENASVKMFDYLIEQNDLRQCFDKYGLHEEDITFIKEQIDESLTGDANDMVRSEDYVSGPSTSVI